MRGFGPMGFCHGTPRDDDEVVLVDTRLEKWAEVCADLPDDVRTVVGNDSTFPDRQAWPTATSGRRSAASTR